MKISYAGWEYSTPGDSDGPFICWHVHHDTLLEPCWSLTERVHDILTAKPSVEIPLRLQVLQPVRGLLPVSLEYLASEVYSARKSVDRFNTPATGSSWDPVFWHDRGIYAALYDRMRAFQRVAERFPGWLDELHAQECPGCPRDGHTIFPERKE